MIVAPYGERLDERPIHPPRSPDICDENPAIVSDGGDNLFWVRVALKGGCARQWVDSGPYALAGIDIPFAITAKLARPECRIVFTGTDQVSSLEGFWEDQKRIANEGIP